MNANNDSSLRLAELHVERFHSIFSSDLTLQPDITVLVGPNASGKTNLIDAIKFVNDALYDGVDRAVGSRGSRAVLHRHAGRRSRLFTIELAFASDSLTAKYRLRVRISSEGESSISYERISGIDSFRQLEVNMRLSGGKFIREGLRASGLSTALANLSYDSDSLMLSVMGDSQVVARAVADSLYQGKRAEAAADMVWRLSNFVGEMRFYHLFPNVMREPKPPTAGETLEEDGENLASVVRKLVRERGEPYRQLVAALAAIVPDICDLRVNEAGGYNFVQLRHRSLSSESAASGWVDLKSESDGTVRMLGLLVALYQDQAPTLLVIEEPELTVHVGALAVLADAFNEVSSRTQIVLTTHSSDLLEHFDADSIRAVSSVDGRTTAGVLSETQLTGLRRDLVTPGEIHRMEGLSAQEE